MSRKLLLLIILLLGIFFRFNNLNWDSGFHLHPDERFLTMVGNVMKIPVSISDYLNPQTSTLNPTNIGYKFYVYGVFPLTLNKILAVISNNDNYNAFTIQGRFLSALADLLVIILVYKTAKLLFNKFHGANFNQFQPVSTIPLWSAFFYAIAVLPIQLSHFFAVDTFLNFFMFASFYFSLKYYIYSISTKNVTSYKLQVTWILSALFFGLALASKVTAVMILPLNLFFILFCANKLLKESKSINFDKRMHMHKIVNFLKLISLSCFLYLFVSYFTLRLADPYIFQSANFFDPRPSKLLLENLNQLKSFANKEAWYPPGVQWINKKPVIFSLINLANFGVGLPYFILIIFGILTILLKNPKFEILNPKQTLNPNVQNSKQEKNVTRYTLYVICFWVILFFLYQSSQFTQSMRYFIIIYPFLAIFAGIGVSWLIGVIARIPPWRETKQSQSSTGLLQPSTRPRNDKIMIGIITIIVIIWPLAFSSIYLNKHSRVIASEWIYKNIPNNSMILSEHWDDALPLSIVDNYAKQFTIKELPVFGADNEEKWRQMNQLLNEADYYILSSNRGWGSIPTVPEKFPRMAKFYNDLFAEKLNYKKVAEFVSYPSTCYMFHVICYTFNDDWSEEAFSVYDHPKVLIFKKI